MSNSQESTDLSLDDLERPEFDSGASAVDWIQVNGGSQIRTGEMVLGDLTVSPAYGDVKIAVNGGEEFSVSMLELGGLVVRNVVGQLVAMPAEDYRRGRAL